MQRSGEPYPGIFIDGRVSVDPVPLEAWEQIRSKEMQHDGTHNWDNNNGMDWCCDIVNATKEFR